MPKIDKKFVIYTKLESLIFYSKGLLEKFPKCEKFALCNNILNNLYQSLDYLIRAYKEKNILVKKEYLANIDVELLILKTNVRLSHSFGYITPKNFMTWNYYIEEIGKMIGGWIKACQKE